jgi:hypothetical protein
LVTGHDWLRSFCGQRLKPYESCYILLCYYGLRDNHCPQCAAILDNRAKFSLGPNEELKSIIDKVAKLFALSESSNEHEAAVALDRAIERVFGA